MQSPELAQELRASRPRASGEVRERVLSIAGRAPAPREPRLVLPPLRRLVLVAAASTAVIAVSGALVYGLAESGSPSRRGVANPPVAAAGSTAGGTKRLDATSAEKQPFIQAVPTRLQQYGASLRVQVRGRAELSDATKHAMRVARLLGGYVAYIRYSAPSHGRGAASLVLRVPIDRVEDAVGELSGLGTILAQNVTIRDVTKAVGEQAKEIARLRAEIARLEAGGVTASERAQLAADKARLDYLTKRRNATVRRAKLARVSLVLTTKPKASPAAATRFHRTLGNAGGALVRELELLLYALIVAGPLLLLGGAVIAAGRARDRRLFERS